MFLPHLFEKKKQLEIHCSFFFNSIHCGLNRICKYERFIPHNNALVDGGPVQFLT